MTGLARAIWAGWTPADRILFGGLVLTAVIIGWHLVARIME
jgi:hypothetical protein